MRYARTILPRPAGGKEEGAAEEEVDKDLQLLLTSSEPLFQSRNPAVSSSPSSPFLFVHRRT